MSLQIWLPFTDGTLRQQGSKRVTVSSGGTVSLSNSGKLGKCATFTSTAGGLTIPPAAMTSFTTKCSVCFWLKINGWGSSYDTYFQAGTGSTPWAAYIFGFLRNGTNSTICFTIGNGNSASNNSYLSSALSLDTWYHVALTYETGKVKIYLNGNLDHEYTTSIVPAFSSITKISIGRSNSDSSYQTQCNMNDLRIYDDCLSAAEIHNIAQGLVLHYSLNRNGWGQENLIAGTDFNGNSKKYTVTSGTEGGFTYTPTETILADTEYTVSCQLRGNANMNLYKLCTGGNESIYWVNRSQLSTTEYRHFSITFTYPSSKTLNQIYICTRYGTSSTSIGDWFEIKPNSLKLEKGSVATTWCPNSSDAFATITSLNSTIEYDCSGFCNNGTRTGTFSWMSDTPKYQVSTKFNTEPNAISFASKFSHLTTFTYSCWIKTNVSQPAYLLMGYQYGNNTSGSLALEGTQGGFHYYAHAGTSGDVTIKGSVNCCDNQWHMITATYDGSKVIVYIDGTKTAEGAVTLLTTARTFSLNYPSGASGRYFNGLLSDARVYATALSAEDVKSLYNNSAYIDNQGNIYGAVYEEV